MFLFKNFIVLTFFVILCFGSWDLALAQSTTTTPNPNAPYYQPTPQITSPAPNSTIQQAVAINIFIPSTVVQKMEVYANNILIGLAKPLDSNSSQWFLNWNSANYPDGQYFLMVRATILTSVGYPIDTFSDKVPVVVTNGFTPSGSTIITPPATSQTNATAQSSDTSQTQPAPEETTTTTPSADSTKQSSQTSTAPTEESPKVTSREWKTVATITFPKKTDHQLNKIEYKIDTNNQEYLVFTGTAVPSSSVTLKITTEPIVITTRADSSGNWEYIFEKPLSPGKHSVEVEIIDPKGIKEKTTSSFLIARAQASAENPTGANLQIVDTAKKTYWYYGLAAAGLIILAVIIIFIVHSVRKRNMEEKKDTA